MAIIQTVELEQVQHSRDGLIPSVIPSFFWNVVYSLRFELVFAGCFLFAYALGQLVRSKARKQPSPERRSRPASPPRQPQPPRESANSGRSPNQREAGGSQHDAATLLAQGKIEPFRLRDAQWLVPRLTQLCHWRAQRALEVYRSALKAGLDLRQIPESERGQLFMALLTSLIRTGSSDDATRLLREVHNSGLVAGSELCTSAVKLLTSKHCFHEGLEIHDLVKKTQGSMHMDKSVWSCLLFCAIETKAYSRCASIFEQLKAVGPPSQKDYWNMVRCGSVNGDWKMMLQIVWEIRERSMEVDNVIYNTVLATCVAADEMDEARRLLEEMDTTGGAPDVITYNTLMKGYAKRGDLKDCFELYELMRKRGLPPSQVTYGILLDGCINNNDVEKASGVFDMMVQEGCSMNTVLYTTLIKGFARERKVDEAMRVFGQMQQEKEVKPDLITFSILLKANFDAGRLEEALALVDTMLKMGVKPDEVIFNNLLSGCAKHGNAELARQLYIDMAASGIKPSTATFSILIRLFSQCKLLDEAHNLLKTEPQKYNMEVEPRLFSQLIQGCIRQRQGRRAIEVYELMYSHCVPNAGMHNSVLGMCVKLNMFDTAAEILAVAAAKGGLVDARDANLVLEGAMRKKKDVSTESCVAAIKALGLKVDQSLSDR